MMDTAIGNLSWTTAATRHVRTSTTVNDQHNPYELPWLQQTTWTAAFGLMTVVAAVGNAIVIWAVMCHRNMRSPTNYFLVNVSVADLLMVTLNGIFNFIFMLYSHWPFGSACCVVNNFVATLTVSASVFSLVAISCDRYTAIMKPLKPRMSRSVSVIVIVIIWLSGGLLAFPNILYSTVMTYQYKDGSLRHLCMLYWPDGPNAISRMDYAYNILLAVVTYLIPMIAMFVVYFRMGRKLWDSTIIGECKDRQIGHIKTKKKVVRMFIVVVAIFALCWLPYNVYFVYVPLDIEIVQADFTQHVYLAFYWLAMSNAMYNPIIYFKMNTRFRRYFLTVLLCGLKKYPAQASSVSCGNSGTQHECSTLHERHSIIVARKHSESRRLSNGSAAAGVNNNGQGNPLKRHSTVSTTCGGSCKGHATRVDKDSSATLLAPSPKPDIIL